MRRLRLLRWITAPSAALWLLAQFAMTGATARAVDPLALSPFDAMTVICTEMGLMAAPLDGDDHGPAGHENCRWCQSMAAAPEPSPPGAEASPAGLAAAADLSRAHQLLRRLGALSAASPRAPPLA